MSTLNPRSPDFRSLKNMLRRMEPGEATNRISVSDGDVPSWQRNIVWSHDEMGLLAYSIMMGYPIGQLVLWKKPNGVRVPIDGRQRMTAIALFATGEIAVPDMPHIDPLFRGKKYYLLEGDSPNQLLPAILRDQFDDYEISAVEFESIDENIAKDIFVKLQGGKSLTKTEIRAALPGELTDFVTSLTTVRASESDDDDDDDEGEFGHEFFKGIPIRNSRKAHRGLCDVLLHEYLYPGQDKHWSSLESMYLQKSSNLTNAQREGFLNQLEGFRRAITYSVAGSDIINPRLNKTYLVLTYFRVWVELKRYSIGTNSFTFAKDVVESFEIHRSSGLDDISLVRFNSALSNAGYAKNRIEERHQLLMQFILRKFPDMNSKDSRRAFTEEQRIAIWERAQHQCQWEEGGIRCSEAFSDFRSADADHIVRWTDGGATSLENGRLLCHKHNRGRPS